MIKFLISRRMNRMGTVVNIYQYRHMASEKDVTLTAECLSPGLTLIVSRSVQLVRENSPMILLSRHYDFASPRNDLPRPYQHPQYLSLMPRDIELEMLIDGCENVPTGMRIRSAQCSHLLETGQPLVLIVSNNFNAVPIENDACSSFMATRFVELGKLISEVERKFEHQVPSLASSRLFSGLQLISQEALDSYFAMLMEYLLPEPVPCRSKP